MRLVASYHGVYDAIEFDDKWSDVHDWYERATLPIEMGGMAIRNMGVVALTAFACSFAASLRHMAVIFPELITLGPQGGFLQLTQSIPSEISAQVVSSVGEYRRLVLQGRFNEDDDFSAILKTIAALEEHVEVNSGEAQLQSTSQASLHWLNVVQRPKKGRSSQGILYHEFIKEELKPHFSN